jgi:thiamine-phosphate pyrophosphorylase
MVEDRRLYLVTGLKPGLAELLEAAIRGGVDIVQIRDKDATDRELLAGLEVARDVTGRHDVPLVVNDRPDLAMLVGADLVHVGQDDLPTSAVRKLGLPVGLSTHTPADVDAADADYLGVGPVFATPTKPGRPAVGLDLVRYAAEHASVPWFAIGGIDAESAELAVGAGATRLAVVRAIADAPDPERAARTLRTVLERAPVAAR